MQIETRIAGIPCYVVLVSYTLAVPAQHLHDIDRATPAEGGILNWAVLDRRRRRAAWLEAKLKPADIDRIEELLTERINELSLASGM